MSVVLNSLKGGLRIGQTMRVLSRTGLGWLLGNRPPPAKMMRETFERLGTTYIKLGQFIASAPSVFPAEYVEEFQNCLDKVTPLPYKTIEKTLQAEFNKPLDQIYSWIDKEPLASASIAQVHAATLVTGEDVVIKVQKPGVRNILLTDLNFLYVTAKVMEFIAPTLVHASLSDIVAEIQSGMLAECDFLQEAKNIETFDKFLRETGNTEACVPRVYHQATTMKVLTMERFYGVPLTDLDAIRSHSQNPEQTLLTAMNTWIASLIHCQFFHADVHAGNLMVLEDGRVGFIDFGIVGSLQPGTWEAMISFMTGKATESYTSMAQALVQIGIADRQVNVKRLADDLEALVRDLEKMDEKMMANPWNVDHSEMDEMMLSIVELGKQHGIRFPREFALLLKQLLYFDRYIDVLAPGMNMFGDERLLLDGGLMPEADQLLH
ncbi:MAG: AarF/UbiB family protein [Salinisphaeraceae bacterium]|nr:AarF/UbiB family protein [Salinisphaeraceae bacterium]